MKICAWYRVPHQLFEDALAVTSRPLVCVELDPGLGGAALEINRIDYADGTWLELREEQSPHQGSMFTRTLIVVAARHRLRSARECAPIILALAAMQRLDLNVASNNPGLPIACLSPLEARARTRTMRRFR